MLEIVLVWIYIFFTSYAVGASLLKIISGSFNDHREEVANFIFRSLTGLVVIMILAGYMSLFLKTGPVINILLIIFSLVYYIGSRKALPRFSFSLKMTDVSTVIRNLFLLAAFILVIVKAAGPINNPDTGAYHLPMVKWIEQFRVIKGLVNIHSRLGFNYQYELLCAVYGFAFIKGSTIHALNGYLMLLMVVYLVATLSFYQTRKLSPLDFIKLVVLFFMMNMNNAISSLSPDFPTTVLVTLVVLLVLQKFYDDTLYVFDTPAILAFIFTLGAVLFKISSAPVLLFCLFFLLPLFKKNVKLLGILFIGCILSVLPYLVRNYFISGYLVYPLYSLDIFDPVWKVDRATIVFEKDIIRYWALGVPYGQPLPTGQALLKSWIAYLKVSNTAYIYLMALLAGCMLVSLGIILQRLVKKKYDLVWLFVFFYICLAYWWYNAPDPRFGNGFIIPFIGIVLAITVSYSRAMSSLVVNATLGVLILLSLFMIKGKAIGNVPNSYNRTSYKLISPPPYIHPDTINLGTGTKPAYYVLRSDTSYCWEACLPCSYRYDNYEYLGEKIEDGFKHTPGEVSLSDSLKQIYYNK